MEKKVLFAGDHLLKHVTPNPLIELNPDRLLNRSYLSLNEYLLSLSKLENVDIRLVFPGHGEFMDNSSEIISNLKNHHLKRCDLIWNALRKGEGLPLYCLIDDVFPIVPEKDLFLAVSELWVHIEVLVKEGRAELMEPGPPSLFRAL